MAIFCRTIKLLEVTMKKTLAILFAALSLSAFAETRTFELGLVSPIQLGSPETSVDGFRLSTIYTVNDNVTGFDWTWIASKTTGTFNGFKLGGIYNQVDKGGTIYELGGFINNFKGNTKVVQVFNGINMGETVNGYRLFSFVNYADNMNGVDLGFVNCANNMEGLQIGLLNYANNLNGYQIGLVNYAKNSAIFPILPFFNKGE